MDVKKYTYSLKAIALVICFCLKQWSKPLTLVDGEKMMGWVAANYLFCVPTIAAATAEVPTALKGG